MHESSSWEILLPLLLALGEDSPEEAFAAFTSHSVEVEACGSVSTHSTDSRHISVKVVRVRQGSAGCHCLHPCNNSQRAVAGAGVSARASWHPLHPFRPHFPGSAAKLGSSSGPRSEQDFFGGLSTMTLHTLRLASCHSAGHEQKQGSLSQVWSEIWGRGTAVKPFIAWLRIKLPGFKGCICPLQAGLLWAK